VIVTHLDQLRIGVCDQIAINLVTLENVTRASRTSDKQYIIQVGARAPLHGGGVFEATHPTHLLRFRATVLYLPNPNLVILINTPRGLGEGGVHTRRVDPGRHSSQFDARQINRFERHCVKKLCMVLKKGVMLQNSKKTKNRHHIMIIISISGNRFGDYRGILVAKKSSEISAAIIIPSGKDRLVPSQ
jgi:hypothetical protein